MKFSVQRRYFLAAIAGLGAAFVLATLFRRKQAVRAPRTVGTAAIGGPFTLTDHTGKSVSDTAFRGRFMLVFFGYTFCPDVCPTSLAFMASAMDELGEAAEAITPLFITVDPERDTPEQLAAYVGNFHPRLIGLTGTPDDISKVAKAYRVYFKKAGGGGEDYLMDHSSTTYLMGRDGKFITHFSHATDSKAMAERIREYL